MEIGQSQLELHVGTQKLATKRGSISEKNGQALTNSIAISVHSDQYKTRYNYNIAGQSLTVSVVSTLGSPGVYGGGSDS